MRVGPLPRFHFVVDLLLSRLCREGTLDAHPERFRLLAELAPELAEITFDELGYGPACLVRAGSLCHGQATLAGWSSSHCADASVLEPGKQGWNRQFAHGVDLSGDDLGGRPALPELNIRAATIGMPIPRDRDQGDFETSTVRCDRDRKCASRAR
jgi:hypothetical protein